MNALNARKTATVFVIVFEAILIINFGFFVEYDSFTISPFISNTTTKTSQDTANPDPVYPMFQDIHVMVFIGFGFLMTFLKRYAFSALGFTFFVASVVIQWAILVDGFFDLDSIKDKISMNVVAMIRADIAAIVILISLGAVIGRISPVQLFLMAVLETVLYFTNEYLGVEVLHAVDAGGSVYVHAFGAYFGLAVSLVLARGFTLEQEGSELEDSSYYSDVTSLIGTLFLWIFWPSFTAGLLQGEEKLRAIINTYLALAASCLLAFALSSATNKQHKFQMIQIQNATLAGGVCIGSAANFIVKPFGALIIGGAGGILSAIGYRYIQGLLRRKLLIFDTCGVNNLHGMPGILSGVIAAILTVFADSKTYNEELTKVFSAMGPPDSRSAAQQTGFQFAALACTLGISIAGGILTGLVIKTFGRVEEKFDDNAFWNLPRDMPDRAWRNA